MGGKTPRGAEFAAVLAGALAVGGCVKAPPASFDEAPVDRLRGVTTLAFVPDPSNSAARLPENVELRTPSPIVTPTPIFPPSLLRSSCREGVVFLRLIIGADGAVREIQESPLGESTTGECGRHFREAVEAAVRVWLFQPAEWLRLAPGEDYDLDGKPDFMRVVERRDIAVYVDIRIEFTLVNGAPEVKVQEALAAPARAGASHRG